MIRLDKIPFRKMKLHSAPSVSNPDPDFVGHL